MHSVKFCLKIPLAETIQKQHFLNSRSKFFKYYADVVEETLKFLARLDERNGTDIFNV